MKKEKKKKELSIERFEVARFRNSKNILGGGDTDGTPMAVTTIKCKRR